MILHRAACLKLECACDSPWWCLAACLWPTLGIAWYETTTTKGRTPALVWTIHYKNKLWDLGWKLSPLVGNFLIHGMEVNFPFCLHVGYCEVSGEVIYLKTVLRWKLQYQLKMLLMLRNIGFFRMVILYIWTVAKKLLQMIRLKRVSWGFVILFLLFFIEVWLFQITSLIFPICKPC